RLAILHHSLGEMLSGDSEMHVVFHAATVQNFESGATASVQADLILVELELLESPSSAVLWSLARRTGATRILATHHFMPGSTLDELVESGVFLIPAPINTGALRRLVRSLHATGRDEQEMRSDAQFPVPRTYSDLQLAKTRELQPSIACECPIHLADIITQLVAFERYSERCKADTQENKELHDQLALQTSHARAVMESLLSDVLHHDGIEL
ncbi:MAG: hypothetical protein ACPHRO_13100, partial [Nannocystaceae bacterium]